ncbi:MAG: T9SS type A sorting domain-containing protein [Flavobacteriales bacterium]|nr:T9SS type A sorting domain-containing protein [Flavobacteriales bacterium]
MKSSLLVALAFFAFTSQASNDVHGKKDPNEVRLVKESKRVFNDQYQFLLRNQPNWQNFLINNGAWYVHFNEANDKPHKAFGKPIVVPGMNAIDRATYFIEHHLSGFGVPTNELEFVSSTSNAHAEHVFFRQVHAGKEVLNARISVRISLDGKVLGFQSDVFDHIAFDNVSLDPSQASAVAIAGIAEEIVTVEANSDVKILPVPEYTRKRTVFRPVYQVTVQTIDEDKVPARYLTYVDAVDGKIWMRKNLVSHCASEPPAAASVSVTDDISLTQPYDTETNSLLPNLEITQGGSTVYTDQNGTFVGLNEASATFRLKGLWSQVFTNGTTPSFTTVLTTGANNIDWGTNANSRESSAYYHVNIVHDYMKTKFPSFTAMDNALPTNIDVAGTCNAFYDGSSINFYQSGAGCNSFALVADVVYHEYGHGINDKYYQSQGGFFLNGAMGEGYADLWALGITDNPVLGVGNSQSLPNDHIRRYDIDPKVYPQDLVGEVHSDGEIIAGAWWDLAQNFGNLQQMMDLYSATFDAVITGLDGNEGEVYVDILVEALQVDDSPANGGDNDITNGTPNDLDIINAFDAHGITLLSNATLNHTPIDQHDDAAINVDMTVINDYPWALSDAIVAYRINAEATWNTVNMTNQGGNAFSADIPAQANGTVVAYYVALQNLNGTLANINPFAANLDQPNVPYYIMVGFDQNRIEDFDNFQDNDWQEGLSSDNNTTGTWTIDAPMGSFSDDGVMVQTDTDHTPGTGNFACAVTGNASNTSAALGDNDVDGGHTTLMTPEFDLSVYTNPAISYWRYYTNSPPSGANPGADWWQVLVTDNGTDWVFVENTKVSDPSFRRVAFRVQDYVDLTENVRVKFIASDSTRLGQDLDGGSLVEGALDDLEVWEIVGGAQSGIDETEVAQLAMYPNPSAGNVRVDLELASSTEIRMEVFNLVGSMVFSKNYGQMATGKQTINLDLGTVSNGIYQMRILTENGQLVRRLEVIR